jgi:hypothetical protein
MTCWLARLFRPVEAPLAAAVTFHLSPPILIIPERIAMSTKLTLLAGTFALIAIADFKNLLGATVPAPPGVTALVPADPSIATVIPTVGGWNVTAGAIGATTIAFTSGPVTAEIAVEVLDPSTPVNVDFTIGPVTPVLASELPTSVEVEERAAQAAGEGTRDLSADQMHTGL